MKLVKIIPSPNDQRDDAAWLESNFKIAGNSQCQGNLRDDMIRAIAMEFNVVELQTINTFNYYSMFSAYMKDVKNIHASRLDLMSFQNHNWFMNTLFEKYDLPIRVMTKSSQIKISEIKEAIEKTNRIVGLHGYFTQSGHAIRINGFDDKSLDVNDPYGFHPYKQIKKGGRFVYSSEKIMSVKPYRLVTLEDI
jgi:hypothetical protein